MNAPTPFRYLPLKQIVPSPTNKRRIRQEKLQELADNIKANGVMQPILVRPIGKDNRPLINAGEDATVKHYEIVAGERRWRASQLAGETTIPAMVRELHDLDALQLQVFENLHRDDLHPMEEAEAFDQLLKKSQDLIGLSVDELALKVHKSRSYVYASLKLLDLCIYARDAFFDGKIGKETAVLIARIPGEKLQTQAVQEIVQREMSFRATKQYIRGRYTLALSTVRWDMHSTTLTDAGSCFSCPKRSGNSPEICSDIDSPDVCTDPDCFHDKKSAYAQWLIDNAPRVIHGEEAKEVAPYGAMRQDYLRNGYVGAEGHIRHAGLYGTPKALLGEDLPEPAFLIDHNDHVIEVFDESAIKQKLQEKIDSGELVIPEKETEHKPSERQLERQAIEQKQEVEEKRRRHIFDAINSKLSQGITPEQQLYILRLVFSRFYDELEYHASKLLEEVSGIDDQQGEFIEALMRGPLTLTGLIRMFALSIAAGGVFPGYGWEGPEDSEHDDDYEQFCILAREFGLDPEAPLPEEPASPPDSAAQAVEQTREVDGVDEEPAEAGQASHLEQRRFAVEEVCRYFRVMPIMVGHADKAATYEPPEPAAPADAKVPPEFAEIKAKALAKKARRQGKKESATADANPEASPAPAAEETASHAKTTIAQRKDAAGWISNDVRKQRVSEGKLRAGHINGEKCLCCTQFNGNDRCNLHDIPTGGNAYCNSFAPTEMEASA